MGGEWSGWECTLWGFSVLWAMCEVMDSEGDFKPWSFAHKLAATVNTCFIRLAKEGWIVRPKAEDRVSGLCKMCNPKEPSVEQAVIVASRLQRICLKPELSVLALIHTCVHVCIHDKLCLISLPPSLPPTSSDWIFLCRQRCKWGGQWLLPLPCPYQIAWWTVAY